MDEQIQKAAQELLLLTDNNVDMAVAAIHNAVPAPLAPDRPSIVNTEPILVDIQNVAKTYKLGRNKVDALKGVSLQIRQSEFIALTGASGSGKSTLLQIIGGLDRPNQGTVIVDGQNISKLRDAKLSKFRNQTVGFVFQFFYLQPFLKVATNVEVPAMFGRKKPKTRAANRDRVIEEVNLNDRAGHLPRELSGGQMQRAAIARALMNSPKLLLADEPTGNLDSANAQAIFELFEQLRKDHGTTIVVVTHDQALASRADRIIKLHDGVLA